MTSAGGAPAVQLSALYQEMILDHFRRPRNKGELADATASAMLKNPLCGDQVGVALRREGDVIVDARFSGCGCSISQASASMMTHAIRGQHVEAVRALAARFGAMLRGDAAAAADESLGDLRALSGVAKFPVRIKCAMLAWEALGHALSRGAPPSP